jgi:hypothetical protein
MPKQDLIPPKGACTMWHRSLQRDAIVVVPRSLDGRTGSAPAGPRPGSAPAGRRPEPGPVGGRAESLAVLAPAEPRLAGDTARATGGEHDPRRDGQPPNAIACAPASAYAGVGGPSGGERGSRPEWRADAHPRRTGRSPGGDARFPQDLVVGASRRWAEGTRPVLAAVVPHHSRGPPAPTSPAATGP